MNRLLFLPLIIVMLSCEDKQANDIPFANFSELYINEILASNNSTNTDEANQYDDWLEVYYTGDESADIGGLFLTDDVDNLTKWMIPEGTEIQSQSFLLFWCDEDQPQGELHTNFKINADGEFIGLVASDGLTIIDSLSFGIQTTDISFGRVPDGNTSWEVLPVPSPSSSNGN